MEVEVADIDFGEGRDGIVPVGTYLNDAAKRMGVNSVTCTVEGHECAFDIESGAELLSEITEDEKEHLEKLGRSSNSRLGCYAQIQKPGVIVVMAKKEADKTNETKTENDRNEEYRKQFGELPLEKKIANLVQLEAMTISETLSYVMNAPYTVFDKIGDVLAEFGFKKEEAEKAAARPGKSAGAKQPSDAKKGATPAAEV